MRQYVLLSVLFLSLFGCSESENQTRVEVESVSADSTQTSSEVSKQHNRIGEFTKNSTTMPIKDQYAVWDSSENTLSIVLSPAKLTNEEKAKLEDGESDFLVLFGKDSPDTSKWQWYPYVVTEITFKSPEIDQKNIKSVYIKAYGIEKQNHTDNLNLIPSNAGKLEYIRFGEEGLSIKYLGESSIMDDNFQWDMEI